jgi:hypothetical protein
MFHERSLPMVKKRNDAQSLMLTHYEDPEETYYLADKTKI